MESRDAMRRVWSLWHPYVMRSVSIQLPEPEPTGPTKDQMYRYRGEIVSIGGAMDWIIHRLAAEYVGSTQPTTGRRWEDIKSHLRVRGLTSSLQPELQDVAQYFKARELAAHAANGVVQVGESTQIFRLYRDGPTQKMNLVTIDDIKLEAAQARAGYRAAQAVGRALDDDQPSVLCGLNEIVRAMLIGRL